MGWRKRIRKAGKKVKKTFKKVQRERLKLHAKVGKVAIPLVAAAATYWGGPIAGEAVAYLGTRIQKKAYEAGIRDDKSMTAHERSQAARKIANRTFKYSQIGVAVGAGASAVAAGASGASVAGTAGQTLLGQGGSKLLGVGQPAPAGGGEEFINDPGEIDPETGLPASQSPTYSPDRAPYGVTQTPYGPVSNAPSSGGGGILSKLGDTVSGLLKADAATPEGEGAKPGLLQRVPRVAWLVLIVLIVLSAMKGGSGAAMKEAA